MTPDSKWMAMIEESLKDGTKRMDAMQAELSTNTATTTEVRDLLMTWKGAMAFFSGLGKLVGWMSRLAVAGGALWAAFYAATHGGKPPGAH